MEYVEIFEFLLLQASNIIISAAEITNADAIHPGYGFLSENATFSKICKDYGIKFIGASAEMINAMGDKASAKATMIARKLRRQRRPQQYQSVDLQT